MKVLNLLMFYKILRLVIIIFTSSYFLGILWYIYVIDFETINYKDDKDHSKGISESNFYFEYLMNGDENEQYEIQNMDYT
jgi:hypothetical protein